MKWNKTCLRRKETQLDWHHQKEGISGVRWSFWIQPASTLQLQTIEGWGCELGSGCNGKNRRRQSACCYQTSLFGREDGRRFSVESWELQEKHPTAAIDLHPVPRPDPAESQSHNRRCFQMSRVFPGRLFCWSRRPSSKPFAGSGQLQREWRCSFACSNIVHQLYFGRFVSVCGDSSLFRREAHRFTEEGWWYSTDRHWLYTAQIGR